MDPNRAENLEADVQIGDFRIERRIGTGGMGVVYLARQVSLDRPVALKVLGSALDRVQDIHRFRREAQAIAKLNHPGIAAVHFVGQDGQVCYIAMEFIDGVSLRTLIDRLASASDPHATIESAVRSGVLGEGRAPTIRFDDPTRTYAPTETEDGTRDEPGTLTPGAFKLIGSRDYIRRCGEITREAALALAHAHGRGVVHRDIKPENLMLERDLGVHLIDFGIARFFEDVTLTNTGALVGTPMYMSPEQVTGRFSIDHRTDIYSLGLVLYELLTLQRPIAAPTREGILRQIVTKPLPPVSWRNGAVPRDLEAVVHKATAKDPDERYQTAVDLAADLGNWLDGRPITATPYRYRFDDREIIAGRPSSVTLAGVWLLCCSIFCLLDGLQGLWVSVSSRGMSGVGRKDLIMLSMAVLYLLAGQGLLLGRAWSRWTAIALSLFNIGLFGTFIITLVTSRSRIVGSYWFPMFVLIAACWIAILAILLRHRTRDWFRLAQRLRSEHEQQAASHR